MSKAAALLLTAHGTAQLLDDNDRVLWSSDDDESFTDEFADEFLGEEDVHDILEFLVDAGRLPEDIELDLRVDTLEESANADLKDTQGI